MPSFDKGPSPNLTWKELGCKDGTPYPSEWRSNRAVILAGIFELIREQCGGQPITVLSAYRTPEYNRKVGGVSGSQHQYGRAMDLRAPKGMTINEFYKIIRKLADRKITAIRGVGKYSTFVHIDVRESDKLALWDYSGTKSNA